MTKKNSMVKTISLSSLSIAILGLSSIFSTAQAANCQVTNVDSWNNGFIVQRIKNTSGRNLNGWQVELKFNKNIKLTNSWNATGVKSTSRSVILSNAGFNKGINNGSPFNAGFQGNGKNIKASDISCNITSIGQSSNNSSNNNANNNQGKDNFYKRFTLPAKIQAEQYSKAYDTSPGNFGSAYRKGDVDIERTNDRGSQYNVGWIEAGEWLEYPIQVNSQDRFDVYLRVASKLNRIKIQFLLDGKVIRSSLETAKTGDWQKFKDIKFTTTLPQGNHTIRVKFLSSNTNINYIHIVPASQSNSGDQTKPKPDPKPSNNSNASSSSGEVFQGTNRNGKELGRMRFNGHTFAHAMWAYGSGFMNDKQAQQDLAYYVNKAKAANKVAQVVVYGLGDINGGSAQRVSSYADYIALVSSIIGNAPAELYFEPDLLGLHEKELNSSMILNGVRYLQNNNPNAQIFIDTTHSNWKTNLSSYINAYKKLKNYGADGFLGNASNYRPTYEHAAWTKRELHSVFGNSMRYIIDTSRNGASPVPQGVINGEWADIKGAGIGAKAGGSMNYQGMKLEFRHVKPINEADLYPSPGAEVSNARLQELFRNSPYK